MSFRILITGSRNFNNTSAMLQIFKSIAYTISNTNVTLIHGNARGADRLAGKLAHDLGWTVEVHPADWKKYGRKAGPIRNQEMVNTGANICLAFPVGESRGTRHCITAAQKAGINTIIVETN